MLPGKKLTPADILQMLRRRCWIIAIPPCVTLFGALLVSSQVPDLYQSDMLIAIDPQRVPDAFVRSTVTLETDRRLDSLQVQVLSRTALLQMIESYDLYPAQRAVLPIEDVVTMMRQNIKVELELMARARSGPPQPTAFHIRFVYTDPQVAAKVTQHLGQLFVEQNVRDRGALAGATNRFLEGQLADARKELEAQERRLEDFRQRFGKELPTQMQSNMQALSSAQLQAQSLVESIARDRDRKQMLDRLYRDAANEPPPPPAARPAAAEGQAADMGTAAQQLAAAKAQLAALEVRYRPEHPDVQRAKRRIAELEPLAEREAKQASADPGAAIGTISPERRESLRQMMAEIESLDRQVSFKESEERRVRGEIAEYQRRLEAVPGLESQWVRLTRDYDTMQAAYRDLLTKSNAAQVAANLEDQDIGERFRIVDPAAVPVHPLPSARVQYNLGGLALGLALGLGLAGFLELRDKSFRSDADVLEVVGLPVLAVVPFVASAGEKSRRQRRQLVASAIGLACLALAGYATYVFKLWKSLT